MANEMTQLNYGGRELTLTKSDTLLALRARPGKDKELDTLIRASAAVSASPQARLGGFRLLSTDTPLEATNATLDHLRSAAAVDVGSHVFHTSGDGVPFVPTGQLFIRFKPAASVEERDQLIESNGLALVEARGDDDLIAKVTALSENPVKVAARLQQSALVAVAEPELSSPGQLKHVLIPSDPLLNEQWHLRNIGKHRGTKTGFLAGADARVVGAWQACGSLGSPDVVVAIIDDGFDLTHPDLSTVDKVRDPWDFTRNSKVTAPDPETQDWHGTACAGVATGSAKGGSILGAAPGASLMPVRWGVDLADSQIEKWFGYVTSKGASVVSCSWGAAANYFPLSTLASEAIARCARNGRNGLGCVIVFASGNDNHDVNDPGKNTLDGFAVHPDVIAVAACTSKDTRSNYSNFGKEIWLCAPSSGAGGWGILTTDVTGTFQLSGQTTPQGYAAGDYTYDFGGTSSACPLVAGICALVLSVAPTMKAAEVKTLLGKTARKIGKPADYSNGHSRLYGHGCVNAEAAIKAAMLQN
ncbi:subtilase family protein [Tahibacter aquaticus]|uniref:Subtilase family protein n=1 Tax=Tahibacter aquaticus TaxID=520092 RepID=A0A4R6YXZ7_9GAMM|nr:S8 family serine peptidase [Tahibacter aquaticus]TDR43871.1 subtilase family protein [Tahibacter aquaticus]